MVKEILGHGNIGYDELMSRIKQRQEELSGFVTPEGAAIIVGHELGVVVSAMSGVTNQLIEMANEVVTCREKPGWGKIMAKTRPDGNGERFIP
jgi:aspartokinase